MQSSNIYTYTRYTHPPPLSFSGHPKAIYQKAIHLEDLLELQHLRDPVSIAFNHTVLYKYISTVIILYHCHVISTVPVVL